MTVLSDFPHGKKKDGEPAPDPAPWRGPRPCGNPQHAACPDCDGEIIVGVFDFIRVPKLDGDGFPETAIDPETGEFGVVKIRLALPAHVARVPHSEFLPEAMRL